MSWFRKRKVEPVVEPISGWEIVTNFADGTRYTLNGGYLGGVDTAECLRYVDALADGLRAAGFDAEVEITRETVTRR